MKKDSVFTQSTGMCFGLIYGVTVGKEQTVNGIRFTPMKYEGLAEVEG